MLSPHDSKVSKVGIHLRELTMARRSSARLAPLSPRTPLSALGALVAAGALLTVSACSSNATGSGGGGSSSSSGGGGSSTAASAIPSESPDTALTSMVPSALKSAGAIRIATDASYAPNEFKDSGGNIVGMDVDLGTAIAQKLGLKAQFQNATFDGIIGGVLARKYDISLSSFTITAAREKQVDMVSYFTAGMQFAVKAGNPSKIPASGYPTNVCGFKTSVQTGTTEADDISGHINPACTKAGKKPIPNGGDKFDQQTDATTSLASGRDDVMYADSPVVAYAVTQSHGQVQALGGVYASQPYGVVIPKGGRLPQAVQGAIKDLMADGTYKKILAKWHVDSGAIATSAVNPAAQ
ncbi:ABC transporter substrate-binding protein [Phaeacidiphilus oryzae]|uniref:ABC transporter substrate-binding protein n=1 Tax=Phaeacidiphilus oryzae TaxID=348818 RepID=UPI000A732212|nr:ABC transporter substrate-binding protein [Phaeacidiphilus oryzae]